MLKYWVWLSELSGLRPQTRLALLRHFGTPEDLYYADSAEVLLTEGITRAEAAAVEHKSLSAADRILADCQRLDIRLFTIQDGAYPDRLKNIFDPPLLLYGKGRMPALDDEAVVAAVGTRSCTPYGVACAEKPGYGLARCGAVVVSGLAKGIDAAAIRGALRGGGVTVGVVGNGLDVHYPRESAYLYEDVAASGILLSEYPPGSEPAGFHFPARNRILSGLSLATLVVEASEKSGALITASAALEQGRDVFAVPGPIDAPNSAGCNQLIRDGAGLVSDAWDILREYEARFPAKLHGDGVRETPRVLGYQTRTEPSPTPACPTVCIAELSLTDDQALLLRTLPQDDAVTVDDLIEQTNLPARRLLAALTVLEIDNLAAQHTGKRYTRAVALKEE